MRAPAVWAAVNCGSVSGGRWRWEDVYHRPQGGGYRTLRKGVSADSGGISGWR